jgi:type IV pilus assembly protein PilV
MALLRGMRVTAVSRGMSLVEVLVALVVLSVGMLGVAVLFVQSVAGSRTALLRTQAVNLASDMADRIRANANAGAAYDLSTYSSAPASHDCAPTNNNTPQNCTMAQLAEDDLARWLDFVQQVLPAPGPDAQPGNVQYIPPDPAVSNSPERYRITVAWREPGMAQGTPSFTYSTDVVMMPRPPVVAAATP